MKNQITMLVIGSSLLLSSCKGILISQEKVPYKVACGTLADYDCRCQGAGTGSFQMFKERLNLSGTKHFNIGRAVDVTNYNRTKEIFDVKESDYELEEGRIDYDFEKTAIRDVTAELKAKLKEEKIATDLTAQITNEFKQQISTAVTVGANYKILTLKQDVFDQMERVINNQETEARFKTAVTNAKRHKWPLVRQVIVIEEETKYTSGSSLSNVLSPILKAKLGSINPKVDVILTAVINSSKIKNLSSDQTFTSAYSYGFYNEDWINQ